VKHQNRERQIILQDWRERAVRESILYWIIVFCNTFTDWLCFICRSMLLGTWKQGRQN